MKDVCFKERRTKTEETGENEEIEQKPLVCIPSEKKTMDLDNRSRMIGSADGYFAGWWISVVLVVGVRLADRR